MGRHEATRGYTTAAGCAMMRRPFRWRKQYTNAPTGHSMAAVTANATNPRVGPKMRQWHGLRLVPHSKQSGTKGQHGGSAAPAACAVTASIPRFILLNHTTTHKQLTKTIPDSRPQSLTLTCKNSELTMQV